MKVTVRGWNRDMGEKELGRHSLLFMDVNPDGTTYRDKPVLYTSAGSITVAWFQELKLTGNYRMEVELTENDIMSLFKQYFGSELKKGLTDRWGLTFSPELVKSILKTVKLSDLTLGDLVAMNTKAEDEKATGTETVDQPANVTPLRRRL